MIKLIHNEPELSEVVPRSLTAFLSRLPAVPIVLHGLSIPDTALSYQQPSKALQRIDPNPCPPDHQIIMFYVEGDRLLAMHYCDGGNRARFDGKMSTE